MEIDYEVISSENENNMKRLFVTSKSNNVNDWQTLNHAHRLTLQLYIAPSAVQTPVTSRIHLPNLQLPSFSGVYTEWLKFFSMFSDLVHDNIKLSDIKRFQHLRSCLTGTVLGLIQSLEASGFNYAWALNFLKISEQTIYISSTYRKILSAQPISQLIDIVNENMRAFQSLAPIEQIGNGFMFYH